MRKLALLVATVVSVVSVATADLKFAVVTNTVTGTGALDFTSSGFGTPKAVIFTATTGGASDTEASNARWCYGFTDGVTNVCRTGTIRDGRPSATVKDMSLDNTCMMIPTINGGTVQTSGVFSNWVTDGVRLDITAAGGTPLVVATMFGGADLANAVADEIVTSLSNAVNTTRSVVMRDTFQPNLVFMAGSYEDFENTGRADSFMSFGWAVDASGGIQQAGYSEYADHGVTTGRDARSMMVSGTYLWPVVGDEVDSEDYELTAFNSDGFDITTRNENAGASRWMIYLALKLNNANFWAGDFDTDSGTDDTITHTDPGFQPEFLMMISSDMDTIDTLEIDANANTVGLGATDGSFEWNACIVAEDNTGAGTDTASIVAPKVGYTRKLVGTAGISASFDSFTADGFRLTYSSVESTVRKWLGLAIGEQSSAAQITYGGPVIVQ